MFMGNGLKVNFSHENNTAWQHRDIRTEKYGKGHRAIGVVLHRISIENCAVQNRRIHSPANEMAFYLLLCNSNFNEIHIQISIQ